MTLPRCVADVLTDHVVFEVECIDRMYLNVYVPQLQYDTGLVHYIHRQMGKPVASTAVLAPVTKAFVTAVHGYARDHHIPWVDFVKGQRKDDIAQQFLTACDGIEQVLFIGRAQEKTTLFRTHKRHRADGSAYPWISRDTGVVNQFYFYCLDEDFGPFFVKFCSYFPFNAKLCINGNHWAQRQAAQAGIGFTPLDNAFAAVEDPAALQAICAELDAGRIDALLRKWLARLPHPFSASDRAAGYRYDLSILQAEFSLTQMLDRPVTGRIFFEQVIRDNLDLGRPDRVGLIFDRSIYRGRKNHTPGTFATRVVTDGVTPSLHVQYKNTQIKQYHKHGRALRTETTINNSMDFDLGKRLTNLRALARIGYAANRRLLRVQRLSHDPITGLAALTAVTEPVTTPTGTRVSGLTFGKPRTHALASAMLMFRMLPDGFTNRDLRPILAELRGLTPDQVNPGQVTYDLRRLRVHGLIERIPHTHRYHVTNPGLRAAMVLACLHDRFLPSALADLATDDLSTPLITAAQRFQHALDNHARRLQRAA